MSVKLRKKKLKGGKVSLYLDVYQNGQRHYEFLRLYLTKDRQANKETLKLAESIRAKRQLEIQNSEHGFVPHFKRKANFVEYFEKLACNKPNGEKAWHNTLNHLKAYTGGSVRFSGISEQWLEEFKAYLLTKVSRNTAHTYFSKIKAALRQAVKDKILNSNPAERVEQIRKEETERSFLTLPEIQALAATPCQNPEVKRAFLFACYTGLRISDIEKLTWSKIQGDSLEFRQKKTGGFEYLPLSETAKKLIYLNRQNPDTQIIPLPEGKVFNLPSRAHIDRCLKQWVKEAGITKRVTFHVSRHTFATLSLTSGADLYTVSKLLGHKQIKATQIYAKIVDEKKKEAVNLLPKIEVS